MNRVITWVTDALLVSARRISRLPDDAAFQSGATQLILRALELKNEGAG